MEKNQALKTIDDLFLKELIDHYYKGLINLSYTYVKDWSTAEDIVQDVFIKVIQKFDSFEEKASIKTWLYRITINQCKDHLRKNYIKRVIVSGVLDSLSKSEVVASPEQSFLRTSMDKDLVVALHLTYIIPQLKRWLQVYFTLNPSPFCYAKLLFLL